MAEYKKPLPDPVTETQPYWDGCKRHELLIQKCDECGNFQFYPRSYCINRECMSGKLTYTKVSGKGKVYTYTINYRPAPGFQGETPYVVALIELDGTTGTRMMSNVVNCDPQEVRVDMPVEVVFEDVTDEITLPKFQPAK